MPGLRQRTVWCWLVTQGSQNNLADWPSELTGGPQPHTARPPPPKIRTEVSTLTLLCFLNKWKTTASPLNRVSIETKFREWSEFNPRQGPWRDFFSLLPRPAPPPPSPIQWVLGVKRPGCERQLCWWELKLLVGPRTLRAWREDGAQTECNVVRHGQSPFWGVWTIELGVGKGSNSYVTTLQRHAQSSVCCVGPKRKDKQTTCRWIVHFRVPTAYIA
jgi:hypothetical protein